MARVLQPQTDMATMSHHPPSPLARALQPQNDMAEMSHHPTSPLARALLPNDSMSAPSLCPPPPQQLVSMSSNQVVFTTLSAVQYNQNIVDGSRAISAGSLQNTSLNPLTTNSATPPASPFKWAPNPAHATAQVRSYATPTPGATLSRTQPALPIHHHQRPPSLETTPDRTQPAPVLHQHISSSEVSVADDKAHVYMTSHEYCEVSSGDRLGPAISHGHRDSATSLLAAPKCGSGTNQGSFGTASCRPVSSNGNCRRQLARCQTLNRISSSSNIEAKLNVSKVASRQPQQQRGWLQRMLGCVLPCVAADDQQVEQPAVQQQEAITGLQSSAYISRQSNPWYNCQESDQQSGPNNASADAAGQAWASNSMGSLFSALAQRAGELADPEVTPPPPADHVLVLPARTEDVRPDVSPASALSVPAHHMASISRMTSGSFTLSRLASKELSGMLSDVVHANASCPLPPAPQSFGPSRSARLPLSRQPSRSRHSPAATLAGCNSLNSQGALPPMSAFYSHDSGSQAHTQLHSSTSSTSFLTALARVQQANRRARRSSFQPPLPPAIDPAPRASFQGVDYPPRGSTASPPPAPLSRFKSNKSREQPVTVDGTPPLAPRLSRSLQRTPSQTPSQGMISVPSSPLLATMTRPPTMLRASASLTSIQSLLIPIPAVRQGMQSAAHAEACAYADAGETSGGCASITGAGTQLPNVAPDRDHDSVLSISSALHLDWNGEFPVVARSSRRNSGVDIISRTSSHTHRMFYCHPYMARTCEQHRLRASFPLMAPLNLDGSLPSPSLLPPSPFSLSSCNDTPDEPGASPRKQTPTIRLADFQPLHVLNKGYAADVHQAFCTITGRMAIMKTYHLQLLDAMGQQHMRREIAILAAVADMPHMVKLWAAFQEDEHCVLIFQFCDAGDLRSILAKHGGQLSERNCIRKVLFPLLTALKALHAAGVVHRDIKPSNVCFTGDGELKLCDLGLALNTRKERARSCVGTQGFMAPELFSRQYRACSPETSDKGCPHDVAALDIWSVGVLAYLIITGTKPYPDFKAYCDAAKSGSPLPTLDLDALSLPLDAQHFLRVTLQQDAAERPSAAELLDHPWIVRLMPGAADGN